MRTSSGPVTRFHCMPHTLARPSAAGGDDFRPHPRGKRPGGSVVRKTKAHGGAIHRLSGFVGHLDGDSARRSRADRVDRALSFDNADLQDGRIVLRRQRSAAEAARTTEILTTRVSGWMAEILSGGVMRRHGARHRRQTEIRKADVQLGTAVAAPEVVLPELGIVDANVIPVQTDDRYRRARSGRENRAGSWRPGRAEPCRASRCRDPRPCRAGSRASPCRHKSPAGRSSLASPCRAEILREGTACTSTRSDGATFLCR